MSSQKKISLGRWLGRLTLGVVVGVMILPAIIELMSLAENVTAFKYQGF